MGTLHPTFQNIMRDFQERYKGDLEETRGDDASARAEDRYRAGIEDARRHGMTERQFWAAEDADHARDMRKDAEHDAWQAEMAEARDEYFDEPEIFPDR